MATPADQIATTRSERLETRLDPETKRLAERAAALGFGSMADYITRLIREDAPKRLAEQALNQVSNEQFDHFLAACNDTSRIPSERLRKAAERLDKEGYWLAFARDFAGLDTAEHNVKGFDCGKDELNIFLARFAAKHARLGISSTWVLTEEGSTGKAPIAAFYTLAGHTVTRGELPAPQKSLPRFQLPVVLIAQLAVSKTYAHQGFGEKTLITALRKAVELSDAGLPAIDIVHEDLDGDALGFYDHFGAFEPFTDKPMRLFIPMEVARQL